MPIDLDQVGEMLNQAEPGKGVLFYTRVSQDEEAALTERFGKVWRVVRHHNYEQVSAGPAVEMKRWEDGYWEKP